MVEFTLPQTAEDILESVVVIWYKSEGELVEAGEVLVEVQTEKATFELEAPVTGVLKEIRVGRAAVAQVGDVLAVIDTSPGTAPDPQERAANLSKPAAKPEMSAADSFVAMPPRLRRLAQELGVDPARVAGTGAGGRITEEDVRRAASGETSGGNTNPSLSATRRTIAQRMRQSLQNSAQLTLHAWADVTTLGLQRKTLYAHGSWNDWILKAVVTALQEHPVLNAIWSNEGVVLQDKVHLGIAVDTDDGLLVPVIRDAHRLTLKELHDAAVRLSEQARLRKLHSSELTGSTFTVTNLGAYGIEFFTPILNPPETAILGTGQVQEVVAVRDGAFEVRQRLPLSLTIDHQCVDGGPAANFLQTVAKRLAEPANLL